MKIKCKNNGWLFVLNKEEEIMSTLTKYAEEMDLKGGVLSGIGAVKNVDIGYYDLEKKEYIHKKFNEMDYELISLTGNITLKNGKPFAHVHASMADRDYNVFAGHVFEMTVAVVAEISCIEIGVMPERGFNESIGLDLICGPQS